MRLNKCARAFGAASAILLLLQSSASAASFTWETQYADGAVLGDGDQRVQDGVIVTLGTSVVSDSDGGTFDLALFPGDLGFQTVSHGQTGAHSGYARLAFDNQNDDPADYLTLTLSFGVALVGLQLSVLDVDSTPGQGWDDGVEITYNGGSNVRSNASLYTLPAVVNPSVSLDNEAGYEGFEGWNGRNAASNQTIGNVALDFGATPITDVTIRYFSTDDADPNPVAQLIGLSDLAWTSTAIVPEPSTASLLGLGLVLLAFQQRRRGRPDCC